MRRAEKEISDRAGIDAVLKKSEIIRLGFVDGNKSYIVPMNFGFNNGNIYIHSAKEGRKIELIKKNNLVAFEAEADVEIIKDEKACNWGMKYLSVTGDGKAVFINDLDDKRKALGCIMEKYSGKSQWDMPDKALENTTVIKIEINSITGKKSGF